MQLVLSEAHLSDALGLIPMDQWSLCF